MSGSQLTPSKRGIVRAMYEAMSARIGRRGLIAILALIVARAISRRRRRASLQSGDATLSAAEQHDGEKTGSGIVSTNPGWSTVAAIGGSILGLGGLAAVLPVLLPIAIWCTACEALRESLGLDKYVTEFEEGSDDQVTIALPGMCTYMFWQLGQIQYLCEHYDTRTAKLAGVSSGGACAAMILALEKTATEGDVQTRAVRVRERSQAIFRGLERGLEPIARWPVGFVARMGDALTPAIYDLLPEDYDTSALGDRVRIGFRRLTGRFIPALLPDSVSSFKNTTEFWTALGASGHVGLMVRPTPLCYYERFQAYCCDGVNPFSLYCVFEYMLQKRRGIAARTAPEWTMNGSDSIYALWNCGAMRVLLPKRGTHLWVTPTVGGKLELSSSLRVSAWWAGEQWRLGYLHAKELDGQGYWNCLPKWPLAA